MPGPERASSTRWKRSNTRPRCSGGMRPPVSCDTSSTAPESPRTRSSIALALAGVADRVLDQVVEHRVDQPRRHRHHEAAVRLRRRASSTPAAASACRRTHASTASAISVGSTLTSKPVALELDEHDHVLDQPAHAVDLEPGLGDHVRRVRRRAGRGRASRRGRGCAGGACAARARRRPRRAGGRRGSRPRRSRPRARPRSARRSRRERLEWTR